MKWAITLGAVGEVVGFRATTDDDTLQPGETKFVTADPSNNILDKDGVTVRRPTLAEGMTGLRAARVNALSLARDQALTSGVVFRNTTWTSTQGDLINLMLAVMMLFIVPALPADQQKLFPPLPVSVPWKDINGALSMMSFTDLALLLSAMAENQLALYNKFWTLEAQVTAASDAKTIAAVVWN